jgi:ADP-ribosyl-[dinitrogen reductase] hydrolase
MEDRIVGMIVGLAAGDALGSPLEFMSRSQIEIKHGHVAKMIGGGWLGLRPGGWTDDTAMMLCLLGSLLEKGAFDQQDVARRYVEWYRTRPVAIGNVVRATLTLMDDEGVPVGEASRRAHEGSGGQSADNDTVMRCAPLAAWYVSDARRLMEASFLDARITNWDIQAASGSALLNLVLSALLRGGKKADAFAWAEESMLANEFGLYTNVPDVSFLAERDLKPSSESAVDTLTAAFWCFHGAASFEEALVRAVNLGGEAGTVGAITGALSGARWGYQKIPPAWAQVLQDRGLVLGQAKRLAAHAVSSPDRGSA